MSNATVSRLGLVNNSGTGVNDLFLKVFSGEVLSTFGRENLMLNMTTTRTIGSGKSAQFPVTGTIASGYHTVVMKSLEQQLSTTKKSLTLMICY
jgi:hypothetical protein